MGRQVGGDWLAELEVRARAHLERAGHTESDVDSLQHELQVHRIELEMQNEELRRSHDALERDCERYRAFLKAAPLGYLALDATGRICEVNRLGARLLSRDVDSLRDQHLQRFLCVADADRFHIQLRDSLSTTAPQTVSVTLQGEGRPARVELRIVPSSPDDGVSPAVWVFITEVSEQTDHLSNRSGLPADESLTASANSERTVLVVDDDPVVRRTVARILRMEGYQVVAACSGAEALEIARTEHQRLDILLSDVRMPGMNGGELGHHMASLRPDLPRIYMSGDIGDVVLEPGATLVAKPFHPGSLVRLLNKRLSR